MLIWIKKKIKQIVGYLEKKIEKKELKAVIKSLKRIRHGQNVVKLANIFEDTHQKFYTLDNDGREIIKKDRKSFIETNVTPFKYWTACEKVDAVLANVKYMSEINIAQTKSKGFSQ